MKRILVLAVIAVFVMMPLASFAKTAISDSELGSVTAQAGVSIDFSGVTVTGVTMTTNSWGDADGFTGYLTAGYIGQTGIVFGGTVVGIGGVCNIDVGTSGTVTKVQINLPTVNIGTMNMDSVIKLDTNKFLTTAGLTTQLGSSFMQGLAATIGGTVTIYAH